jgi:hypothetical protein
MRIKKEDGGINEKTPSLNAVLMDIISNKRS